MLFSVGKKSTQKQNKNRQISHSLSFYNFGSGALAPLKHRNENSKTNETFSEAKASLPISHHIYGNSIIASKSKLPF